MRILDENGIECPEGKSIFLNHGKIIEIGKEHRFKYTLENNTSFKVIDLKIQYNHPYVKLEYPTEFAPMSQAELLVIFNPPIDFKKKLELSLHMVSFEVYD